MQNLNNAQILTDLTKRFTMITYPAAPTELTVRRLSVDLSQGFSRHWHGGDAFLTAYANALSMSFPVGEQSFIDAVKAGERVTLTVHGEPVADIVPHRRRARWLSGERLRDELVERSADARLTKELDDLAGQTLDDL